MNPYETTDHPGEIIPQVNPTDHRCYTVVLKMVLWDEPKEEIDQKMRINKIPPELAAYIYRHARAERVRTIRSEYLKRLLSGVILLGGASLTFIVFWFGLSFIPKILLYTCFLAIAFGIWKSVDGLTGYVMAAKKTGSVADEI